jgi:hypothetical protein
LRHGRSGGREFGRGGAVAALQNLNPHTKPQSHEGSLLWQRQSSGVFEANSE